MKCAQTRAGVSVETNKTVIKNSDIQVGINCNPGVML